MAGQSRTPEPKVLNEFPPQRRASVYPWEKWTDGKIRELVKGVHYKSKTSTMRQAATKHAAAAKLSLRSQVIKDGDQEKLVIQFVPKRS